MHIKFSVNVQASSKFLVTLLSWWRVWVEIHCNWPMWVTESMTLLDISVSSLNIQQHVAELQAAVTQIIRLFLFWFSLVCFAIFTDHQVVSVWYIIVLYYALLIFCTNRAKRSNNVLALRSGDAVADESKCCNVDSGSH